MTALQVRWTGRDRQGVAQAGQLELEPLELEALVRRRYRAGWLELEVVRDAGGPGEQVGARIFPRSHGRGRDWWAEVPLGLGQQQLELGAPSSST